MGRLRSVLRQILKKLKRSASNGGSTNMSIWSTGTVHSTAVSFLEGPGRSGRKKDDQQEEQK
jgi:hypothetical protein